MLVSINTQRYERWLRRIWGIRGSGGQGQQGNAEISAYLGDGRPEDQFALGYQLSAFNGTAGAVVGRFTYNGIANPLGTGRLIVITMVRAGQSGLIHELSMGPIANFTPAPTLGNLQMPRDSRLCQGTGPDNDGAAWLTGSQAVAGPVGGVNGLVFDLHRFLTEYELRMPIVLHPGFAAYIIQASANATLNVSWEWYSRPLERDEALK